jgi:hypothetical protein
MPPEQSTTTFMSSAWSQKRPKGTHYSEAMNPGVPHPVASFNPGCFSGFLASE